MERRNHSSSTTWRPQLRRREPRFGRGGCAICRGELAHRGRGDAPPHSLACKSPPHSTHSNHPWPNTLCCLAPALCFAHHPEKPRKSTAPAPARSAREPTVKTRAGAVSLSLLYVLLLETQGALTAFGARPAALSTIAFCAARRGDAVILSHPR